MSLEAAIGGLLFFSAGGSLLAGFLLLALRHRSSYRWLALMLLAAGVSRSGDATAFFLDLSPTLCKGVGVLGQALLPAFLVSFTSSLQDRAAGPRKNSPIAYLTVAMYAAGCLWSTAGLFNLLYVTERQVLGDMLRFSLTPWGIVYKFYLLLALTFGIMQVEKTLGAVRNPDRYRFKWILLGAAALAGAQVLQVAYALGLGTITVNIAILTSVSTLFALALVIAGLIRTRLRDIREKVYVSPVVMHGSATLLLVGAYLMAVGLVAEWVRDSGGLYGPGLGYATVFAGILALTTLAVSRTVQLGLKDFIARHFYRSVHDYRAKWREVTEAFQSAASVDAILDKLIDVLSKSFQAGRISIWMTYDSDRVFHQVRSMNTIKESVTLPPDHPLLVELSAASAPLDVTGAAAVDSSEKFLHATHAVLLVPLKTGEKLIAFAALSRPSHGEGYTTDDKDLLHGIAHHAAVLLAHAALSEEQAAGVKLNALHHFSAFCLHDIKNLSARLSLVVQNAKVHGHDPAFQKSAMQTVERTVARMTELIAKLAADPPKEETPRWTTVRTIIEDTLASVDHAQGELCIDVSAEDGIPVCVNQDQVQQVLLNLVLNAIQAGGGRSGIRVRAWLDGEIAYLEVSDQGPGIEESQLRTLLQPFRSTKEDGLGIGLYQCRQVIERLGGRFTIRSRVGQGTVASIELPIAPRSTAATVHEREGGKHVGA
jgi:putative PEP-CTERM system histidine kinase